MIMGYMLGVFILMFLALLDCMKMYAKKKPQQHRIIPMASTGVIVSAESVLRALKNALLVF
jgi:hypothetical protein